MKTLFIVVFVFTSCSVLLSKARVAPTYESGCPTGFVGVGICLYPNNKCSIGFCHQDPFKIPEAFVGVCCIRTGSYYRSG
uniref:Uncharacterized protein n=1 Tax=Magallana gigas TaxID=29159 RepID=A0A8W8MWE5_MAGGI